MDERKITDGGRDLLAFIRRTGESIPDWCEAHRLSRFQIQKIINGTLKRGVSVDLAFALERATRGRVKAIRFVGATASTKRAA